MLDRGPCPPGKYIIHPAECKRAAVEVGMKLAHALFYEYDYGPSDDHINDIWLTHTQGQKAGRHGCLYFDRRVGNGIIQDVVYLSRFGGLFYFYFFIGQVHNWTTARQSQSGYLQMLTEEIQKENIKYIKYHHRWRCSTALKGGD